MGLMERYQSWLVDDHRVFSIFVRPKVPKRSKKGNRFETPNYVSLRRPQSSFARSVAVALVLWHITTVHHLSRARQLDSAQLGGNLFDEVPYNPVHTRTGSKSVCKPPSYYCILCPSKSIKNATIMTLFTRRMGFGSYRESAPFLSPWYPSTTPPPPLRLSATNGPCRRARAAAARPYLRAHRSSIWISRYQIQRKHSKFVLYAAPGNAYYGLMAWMTWSSGLDAPDGRRRRPHVFANSTRSARVARHSRS